MIALFFFARFPLLLWTLSDIPPAGSVALLAAIGDSVEPITCSATCGRLLPRLAETQSQQWWGNPFLLTRRGRYYPDKFCAGNTLLRHKLSVSFGFFFKARIFRAPMLLLRRPFPGVRFSCSYDSFWGFSLLSCITARFTSAWVYILSLLLSSLSDPRRQYTEYPAER